MSVGKLIQEFRCDHQYCWRKARIATGSIAYGTNYQQECNDLEKRGWAVIGLKHYCKQHKALHNWGSDTVATIIADLDKKENP